MDYGKAITHIFHDRHGLAILLVGGAINLLGFFFFWTLIGPILAQALLLGYMMQLIRDVREDPDAPLPPWDDWGRKLNDGLRLLLAQVIWKFPLGLVVMGFALISLIMGLFSESEAANLLGLLWAFGYLFFLCFTFLYGIVILLLDPAITLNLTIHDRFAKAFALSELFHIIKTRLGDIVIIAILVYGLNYVAGLVGMMLFFVGLVVTSFWVMLVKGHLYGQLARLTFPTGSDAPQLPPSQPASPSPAVTD
jgi:hypothetical protein